MRYALLAVIVAGIAGSAPQGSGHPFDADRIVASIDSFVVVTRAPGGAWRSVAGTIQTVARDSAAIRVAVDYVTPTTKQRVEMGMHPKTLAPIAHFEELSRRGSPDTRGQIMFSGGRARGAFILSKGIVDVAVDSTVIDDDASTVLLTALPLDTGRAFTFRTFASPGQVERTRVEVTGMETVTVPAGTFPTYRLVVMARDTSSVFVTRTLPRRVVLVRLGDGSQEMRLINRR